MTSNNYDEPCVHCAALVPKGTGLLVEVPLGAASPYEGALLQPVGWWALHHACEHDWRATALAGLVCGECGGREHRGWCTHYEDTTATLAPTVLRKRPGTKRRGIQ